MKKMEINGKIAIITGASSGIGLATAKLFHKEGAKLALVARSTEKLEQIAKELKGSLPITADLSKIEQVQSMIKKAHQTFGRIDILVNNAGKGYDAPAEKTDPEILQYMINLDFVYPVMATKEVIPIMRKQGGGAIINVSSGTALMFLPEMSVYSALKSALGQFSLVVREELKENNIVVNVIYPYITLTDFEKNTFKDESVLPWKGEGDSEAQEPWAKADTAEYVAEKIVQGIKTGKAEIFAHEWMKHQTPE